MTLTDLLSYVKHGWPFITKTYPRMGENEVAFAIKHVSEHMGKATGKIVAAIEPYDHGKAIDIVKVREQTAYSLVNTLRMATLVGMTDEDLLVALRTWREGSLREE